ncbi:hypothetical protein MMC25_001359 [Agyrium rufum]|nr:hypothetical protein [Agyrium rufum]
MGFSLWTILAVAALPELSLAASGTDWATRSIYQVITDRFALTNGSTEIPCADPNDYCGGTWQGLINKLDYIQGMGFTAIQISPIEENIPDTTVYGTGYHGYWPQSHYSLNANFGTADDLNALATELHNRGMYLLGDITINQMAQALPGNITNINQLNYSAFDPYNDVKYFHPLCSITDYLNETNYQDCWFGTEYVILPDLYTEHDDVINMTQAWISGQVSNYSFDGLRIDAAKHVNTAFLPTAVAAAGVFTFGEVDSGPVDEVCAFQNVTGVENYPYYYSLIPAFTAGDMLGLSDTITSLQKTCTEPSQLSVFVENQDQPRFATLSPDITLATNALAFSMLSDGIPKMYQGQEQFVTGNYSPYNRIALWGQGEYDTTAPLYELTATLNNIRNHAINIDSRYVTNMSTILYVDNSTLATTKGPDGVNIVAIFSNQGSTGGAYELSIGPNAFQPGTNVTELLSCNVTTADATGNITAMMNAGVPHVFFPSYQLNGSGLCGSDKQTNTSSSGAGSSSGSSNSSSSNKTSVAWSTHSVVVEGGLAMWVPTAVTCAMVVFGIFAF